MNSSTGIFDSRNFCLKCKTALQRLSLRNVGCSDKACKAVDELLDAPNLQGLYLYNNMSGDAGAHFISNILSKAPMLQEFQMGSSRVGAEGSIALSKGLCTGVFNFDQKFLHNNLLGA